ncbi:hypothetical protein [Nocardioides montaniterrae]
MSRRAEADPWGAILTILTVLAIANAWLKPFDDHGSAVIVATQASSPFQSLVRRTHGWAPVDRATVTPGIQTLTGDAQCTTNFVFTDADQHVYLGQAAHCASLSEEMDGCKAKTRPLGTPVAFQAGVTSYGAGKHLAAGRLAYSSWRTMQQIGVTDPVLCSYNDFALVRVDRADVSKVNPTMPYWGGPNGVSVFHLSTLDRVYGYGKSSLRRADSTGSRQAAQAVGDRTEARGWAHVIISHSPGIPGDSGSGYLDKSGLAIGTLSTLGVNMVMYNRLGDLFHELTYARRYSHIRGLRLELGTVRFRRQRAEDTAVTR